MENQEQNMTIVPIAELAISSENKNRLDEAKNRLQAFANSVPEEVKIYDASNMSKFSWIGGDKVTSEDLNITIGQIRNEFISQNNTLHTLFREFGTVYETVSVLDEGYIKEILKSFNLAAQAFNTAQKNFKKTIEQFDAVNKKQATFIKKQKEYNAQFEEQISELSTVLEEFVESQAGVNSNRGAENDTSETNACDEDNDDVSKTSNIQSMTYVVMQLKKLKKENKLLSDKVAKMNKVFIWTAIALFLYIWIKV